MAAPGITVLKHNVPWGPFTRAQVEEAILRGDFTVKYLAHAPGLSEWLPLGEVLDYVAKSEGGLAPALPPVPGPRDVPSVAPILMPPVPAPVRPPSLPVMEQRSSVPAMPAIPAPKPAEIPERVFETASFFARGFAFVIDCLILFVPVGIVYALCALAIEIPGAWNHISHQTRMDEWELLIQHMKRLLLLVAVGISWIYAAGLESSVAQATVGKRWMGIKVVDAAGERLSFLRATGRYAGKYLSALPCFLGFIMALFSSRRLALHDRLAGTRVVRS